MKRVVLGMLLLFAVAMVSAMPAYRGWMMYEQADGSTIELRMVGDEYCHFLMNHDGEQVRLNEAGMYEAIGAIPTEEVFAARHAASKKARQSLSPRKADIGFGVTPNPAPKGVVILVNFSDKAMASGHTQAVFDELCNSENCTVNGDYPSAAEYFEAQSGGQYRPQFDVFGPVTLSGTVAHYGKNKYFSSMGESFDQLPADAVVEGCLLADSIYDINFADYDSNGDGLVDFVYVIYAGRGEADGGESNTIWPHNWDVYSAIEYGLCTYPWEQCELDGVMLSNYAMSNELVSNGWWGTSTTLCGIGTLCHEFGHVIGLPDFYDTAYGTNYSNSLTPNDWDVMDGGGYNGSGHCPPNYSPWEKYFFGWTTPTNIGNDTLSVSLYPNGTEEYNPYQLNSTGVQQAPAEEGICYYLESRKQSGWDDYIPASGMVIWKVQYDTVAWMNNEPNNTANHPLYTIVCSSGTRIGSYYGSNNVFPNGTKKSWTGVTGRPVIHITKGTNGVITFDYQPKKHAVHWKAEGGEVATEFFAHGEPLRLPEIDHPECGEKEFIGWTQHGEWADPFIDPEDLFAEPKDIYVTEEQIFNALFQ